MDGLRAGLALLALVLFATPALAHVPTFPADNTTPERAVEVPDPVKSWSFYDRLEPGQTKYYRVSLRAGERLHVGTFTPDRGRVPSLVVASPSLDGGATPPGVEVPDGMGAVVVEGERPGGASYEPFAPSANYHTASLDRPVDADATFLVAVYDPANRSGPVGVTVGYEEAFSPTEYVTVPFDLVRTHRWAGQSLPVAIGPYLLAALAGGAVVRRRAAGRWSPARVALAGGGLLVFATGVNTAVQMALALSRTGPTPGALVTAAFVVVPLVCGGWVVRVAVREAGVTRRTRLGLVVAGAAALATWAGFILGPAVVIALAAAPRRLFSA